MRKVRHIYQKLMKLCRKTENLNQFSIGVWSVCLRLHARSHRNVVRWQMFLCLSFSPEKLNPTLRHADFYSVPISSYSMAYFYSVRESFLPKPSQKSEQRERESERTGEGKEESDRKKIPSSNIFFFEIVPVVHNVVGWWWMRNDSRFPSFFGFGYLFASTLLSPSSSSSSSSVFMYATKISRKISDLVEYNTHATARSLACSVCSLTVLYMHVHKNTIHIVFRCGLPSLHQFSPRVRHSIGLNNHRWKKY